jgi:hypothetical protein
VIATPNTLWLVWVDSYLLKEFAPFIGVVCSTRPLNNDMSICGIEMPIYDIDFRVASALSLPTIEPMLISRAICPVKVGSFRAIAA